MNPVVLIATHERFWITSKVIQTLGMQTIEPEIVVVSSDPGHAGNYTKLSPKVRSICHLNHPLGNKWQLGVNQARKLNADPLIICGSDDILQNNYVEKCCRIIDKEYDFIGLKSWYVYDLIKLYHFQYLARMPLGGGRAYSKAFLDSIDWRLFDTSKDRHLDDLGWNKVEYNKARKWIINDPLILSIKGNWPVMNHAKDFFRSPNARLLGEKKIEIMKEKFNYAPEGIL